MKQKIKKPPEVLNSRLILVPGESIDGDVNKITLLDDGEKQWKVFGRISFNFDSPYPMEAIKLASNITIDKDALFKAYSKSEMFYLFFVE